jgi:hypothetical protein
LTSNVLKPVDAEHSQISSNLPYGSPSTFPAPSSGGNILTSNILTPVDHPEHKSIGTYSSDPSLVKYPYPSSQFSPGQYPPNPTSYPPMNNTFPPPNSPPTGQYQPGQYPPLRDSGPYQSGQYPPPSNPQYMPPSNGLPYPPPQSGQYQPPLYPTAPEGNPPPYTPDQFYPAPYFSPPVGMPHIVIKLNY